MGTVGRVADGSELGARKTDDGQAEKGCELRRSKKEEVDMKRRRTRKEVKI